MNNTKDFVPVQSIIQNTAILNDGSVAMVIQTSAVNFDLLSENEQLAIIGSFAAFLNSLSFSIQILIRSKKLDISHYLNSLKDAERKQHNPLLQLMMQHYRAFVAAIIRDNEVLDKQFFVVLAVSPIELGVVKSTDEKSLQKALTILNPRRDHILKQLSRIGLKSDQLDNERLIKLYYDIYNDEDKVSLSDVQGNPANQTPQNAPTKFEHGSNQKPLNQGTGDSVQRIVQNSPATQTPPSNLYTNPLPPTQQPQPSQTPNQSLAQPIPTLRSQTPPQPIQSTIPSTLNPPRSPLYSSPQTANPFVVEELPG